MKTALVGYSGFVGGNLAAVHSFDALYNSRNIEDAFGSCPDMLVYSGVRAEKFLANRDSEADLAICMNALDNIRRISPKKLVLISTADVYKVPVGVNEATPIDTQGLHPYGLNRYLLEQKTAAEFDALIVRLPALFGKGLKKNFVFDALTITPSMLNAQKYAELCGRSELVKKGYTLADNGFYKLNEFAAQNRAALREFFLENDWNALYFTDSRSSYQFYPLSRLWSDIQTALAADLRLLNITSAPLTAAEIHEACFGRPFVNELPAGPVAYDIKSIHAPLFGGEMGYCIGRDAVLRELKAFCTEVKA